MMSNNDNPGGNISDELFDKVLRAIARRSSAVTAELDDRAFVAYAQGKADDAQYAKVQAALGRSVVHQQLLVDLAESLEYCDSADSRDAMDRIHVPVMPKVHEYLSSTSGRNGTLRRLRAMLESVRSGFSGFRLPRLVPALAAAAVLTLSFTVYRVWQESPVNESLRFACTMETSFLASGNLKSERHVASSDLEAAAQAVHRVATYQSDSARVVFTALTGSEAEPEHGSVEVSLVDDNDRILLTRQVAKPGDNDRNMTLWAAFFPSRQVWNTTISSDNVRIRFQGADTVVCFTLTHPLDSGYIAGPATLDFLAR